MRRVGFLFCAGLLSAAAAPFPARAMDREGMNLYVLALASGVEAKTHCTGMQPDMGGMSLLLDGAKLTRSGDEEALDAEIRRTKIDVETAIKERGEAEWCAAVWRLFGPNGLHAIERR